MLAIASVTNRSELKTGIKTDKIGDLSINFHPHFAKSAPYKLIGPRGVNKYFKGRIKMFLDGYSFFID